MREVINVQHGCLYASRKLYVNEYPYIFIAKNVQWFVVNRRRNSPVVLMERWKRMMTDEVIGILQRYQKD